MEEEGRNDAPRLVVSHDMLSTFNFKMILAGLAVIIYMGSGIAFFMVTEDFHFTETVFFLIQTFTTVGCKSCLLP